MTKQEILDYLDNVLHPIVSPDNWNVYSETRIIDADALKKKGRK